MEERSAARHEVVAGVARELVCGQASRTWRRGLGALAWAALEELALTAGHDDQGWASPAGIRAIAAGIGTTDAAAVRVLPLWAGQVSWRLRLSRTKTGTAASGIGCISHTASSCASRQ